MAIELVGKMDTNQIKTQLEKIATKDNGKCLCQNLTTSFKNVSNPICTVSSMTAESWASAIVLALYSWEYVDKAVEPSLRTKNHMLDAFAKQDSYIGETLYFIASILKNNFVVFPLDNLRTCNTWNELFNSKVAVDELCSFYPLVSIVEYVHGERLATAIKTHGSKIVYIKDGYFWNEYDVSDRPICGVFNRETQQRPIVERDNGFVYFPQLEYQHSNAFFFCGFNDYEKSVIPVMSRFYKTTVSATLLNTRKSGEFMFDTTYNEHGTKYVTPATIYFTYNKSDGTMSHDAPMAKLSEVTINNDTIKISDFRVAETDTAGRKEHNDTTGVGYFTTTYPIKDLYIKFDMAL